MNVVSWQCRLVGDGVTHHKLHRHIHPGNGKGVLAALIVAGRGPSNSWPARFQNATVTPAERRALRITLLQVSQPLKFKCSVSSSLLCADLEGLQC